MSVIEVRGLHKSFGKPEVLRDVNFSVEEITLAKFFSDDDLKKFGINGNEKFHICRKLIE